LVQDHPESPALRTALAHALFITGDHDTAVATFEEALNLNPQNASLRDVDKTVHDYNCDNCRKSIRGYMYMCKGCDDYELCHACYTQSPHPHGLEHEFAMIPRQSWFEKHISSRKLSLQKGRQLPVQLLFANHSEDFDEDEIVAWFSSSPERGMSALPISDLVSELSELLLPESPAVNRKKKAVSLALTFLNRPFARNDDSAKRLGDHFLGLHFVYPDAPLLRLSAAKAYLQARDPQTAGYGVFLVEGIFQDRNVLPDPRGTRFPDFREKIEKRKAEIYAQVDSVFECTHLLDFGWKSPNHFQSSPNLFTEIAKRVAITAIITESSKSDTIYSQIDLVENFIRDHWGASGIEILRAYVDLLGAVLLGHDAPQIKRCNWPPFTFVGTKSRLYVSAVCFEREWKDLLACVTWLDGVLGLPTPPRLSSFSIVTSQENSRSDTMSETILALQISELHELAKVKFGRSRFHPELHDVGDGLTVQKIQYSPSIDGRDVVGLAERPPETPAVPRRWALGQVSDIISRAFWFYGDKSTAEEASGSSFKRSEDQNAHRKIREEKANEGECWKGMFNSAFIGIYTLPVRIPPMVRGKGAQMTFELMCTLASIEQVVLAPDGGLILSGFRTALIPIQRLPDGRGIQWHFVAEVAEDQMFRMLHQQPRFWESIPQAWLRVSSLEELKTMAYVGWHPSVSVLFGTCEQKPQLKKSHLPAVHTITTSYERQFGLAVQFGAPLPVNATVSALATVKESLPGVRFAGGQTLYTKISEARKKVIFIYDDERRTAWMCRLSHLISYMARKYMLLVLKITPSNPHRLDLITEIEATDIEAGRKWLENFEKLIIDRIWTGSTFTYGDLLTRVCLKYIGAFSQVPARNNSFEAVIGYEVVQLIEEQGTFHPKRLKLNDGIRAWCPLIGGDDVVFCRRLDDAVVAKDESRRCSRPPAGSDILVSPMEILRDKFEDHHNTEGIGPEMGYRWDISGTPYSCSCQTIGAPCNGVRCWKQRLQNISGKGNGWRSLVYMQRSGLSSPSYIPWDGEHGICFGVYCEGGDRYNQKFCATLT
jgi:Zinc finger, ZZ type